MQFMQKQEILCLDQFLRLVKNLPEIRSEMMELSDIVRAAHVQQITELLGTDFHWSEIYELHFSHGIALLFLGMGRAHRLLELSRSDDPQGELLDWMEAGRLDDWNGGDGGLFEASDMVGLLAVMHRNILSLMLYSRTLAALVEEVRAGRGESLFLAVRADRSIISCPMLNKWGWTTFSRKRIVVSLRFARYFQEARGTAKERQLRAYALA